MAESKSPSLGIDNVISRILGAWRFHCDLFLTVNYTLLSSLTMTNEAKAAVEPVRVSLMR